MGVVDAVDAVYDRASLVALEPGVRRRYADHLTAIIPHEAPIFLISFEYDTDEMDGPPFSVAAGEIRELFPAFDAEVVADDDAMASNADLAGRGLTGLRETLTVLRR